MKTGKFARDGREMLVGDIVHFRCKDHAICGKGEVYLAEKPDWLGEDLFRIRDIRPGRNFGRIYPYYEDGKYRIDGREERTNDEEREIHSQPESV